MATTNYVTVNGIIVGESTGGVNRAYGTDALGSVVATYSGAVKENTYQYKPYGGLLAKTGLAPDPSFLWNGGSGYRATGLPSSDAYVRRRHFSALSAQWTTLDPHWPSTQAYAYCLGSPIHLRDPSGLDPTNPPCPGKCTGIGHCLPPFNKCPLPNIGGHSVARTMCDKSTGETATFSCFCDDCSKHRNCIDEHEAQHRKDMADCCKGYGNCQGPSCDDLWAQWQHDNLLKLECRAYQVSVECAKAVLKECASNREASNCCVDTAAYLSTSKTYLQTKCVGLDLTLTACPFTHMNSGGGAI